MGEWHLDPVVVFKTWTEEQLQIFLAARGRRGERQEAAMEDARREAGLD